MTNKLDPGFKLAVEVLSWWEEHRYDVDIVDGEEFNKYDKEPLFVTLATKIAK